METDRLPSSIRSIPRFRISGSYSSCGISSSIPYRPHWADRVLRAYREQLTAQEVLVQHSVTSQGSTRHESSVLQRQVNIAYQQYLALVSTGESVDPDEFCSLFPYQISRLLQRQLLLFCFVDDEFGSAIELLAETKEEAIQNFFDADSDAVNDYIDHFHIQEELGSGSFAKVYKATEDGLGHRTVVIKVGAFGDYEAGTLGRLCHPNIVPIYSFTTDSNGISVMCMPYMGRETLREKLVELRHLSYSSLLPDVVSHFGNPERGELNVVSKLDER